MKKSIISFILLAISIGAVAQNGSWSDDENIIVPTILHNKIEIFKPEELAWVAQQVNNGEEDFYGWTITLAENIDLSAHFWEPIGYGTDPDQDNFRGTFSGNGFEISGLYIDKPEDTGVGLFGYIYNPARIEKVKITSGSIRGNYLVGAIVGNYCGHPNSNTVGIFDCEVAERVKVVAEKIDDELTGYGVGGIVGYLEYATISHCVSAATVVGDECVGGIAGMLFGGEDVSSLKPCIVTECYNLGEVTELLADETGEWVTRLIEETDAIFNISLLNDDTSAAVENYNRLKNYAGMNVNVTLQGSTLYKDNTWNTLCVPFYFKKTTLEGTALEGPKAMCIDNAELEENTLTIDFTDVDEFSAGYPYILKWDADGGSRKEIKNPVFNDVQMAFQEELDPKEEVLDVITFKGTYYPYQLEANNTNQLYLSDDNTICYPEADVNINSFHAYFLVNNPLGDVNGDGTISVADVMALVDYVLHLANEDFLIENADTNHDGTISVADVMELVDMVLGVSNNITEFNVVVNTGDDSITYGGGSSSPAHAGQNNIWE